jgi:AraC-like DNA-binding protein
VLSSVESVSSPPGRDGIELLQATFERHVYDRHIHDTYAIGVTLRGVQRFWCRGAVRDSTPGRVMVIPPGEVHDGRSGSPGGYAYRMLYVPIAHVHAVLDESSLHGDRFAPHVPLLFDPALADLIDAGWRAMAAAPSSLAAEELLVRGLTALVRRVPDAAPRRSRALDERPLRIARDYLAAHLQQPVAMGALSALTGMSRFQLTRRFQQRFGLPLHGYHLHLRLEEAKRRLASGTAIASVAADLGFVDQSHLHRRFKGAFGMTPGQWRAARGYKTGRPPAEYRPAHDANRGRPQTV